MKSRLLQLCARASEWTKLRQVLLSCKVKVTATDLNGQNSDKYYYPAKSRLLQLI